MRAVRVAAVGEVQLCEIEELVPAAAEVLLRASAGNRLQWACLAHLSEQNNHPDVALRTHRAVMAEKLTLYVADRYQASALFTVS